MKLGQQCTFLIPIGNNEDRFGTGVILELGQKIKVVLTSINSHDQSLVGTVMYLPPDSISENDKLAVLANAFQSIEYEFGVEYLCEVLAKSLLATTSRVTSCNEKKFVVDTSFVSGVVIAKRAERPIKA